MPDWAYGFKSAWNDLTDVAGDIGGGALSAVGAIGDAIVWPIAKGIKAADPDSDFANETLAHLQENRDNPAQAWGGHTPGDLVSGLLRAPTFGALSKEEANSFLEPAGNLLAIPADYTSDVIAAGLAAANSARTGNGFDWSKAWDAAHPSDNAFDALNAPNQLTPGQALFTPFWGKDPLKRSDINALRNDGMYNFATGIADLGNTIFLDPLVLGGKVAKGLRLATETRPITGETRLARGVQKVTGSGFKGATHQDKVTAYLDSTSWNKIYDWSRNRSIDEIAELMPKNESRTQIAAALKLARNKSEFDQVGRIALGDAKAFEDLRMQNENLALGIANAFIVRDGLMRGGSSKLNQFRVTVLNKQIDNMQGLQAWQERLMDLPPAMQFQTPGGYRIAGQDIGTGLRLKAAERRAGRNLKTQTTEFGNSFAYSAWHSGNPLEPVVLIARQSRPGTAPTGWLDLNRADGYVELRNMLNLSPLDEASKAQLMEDYQYAYSTTYRNQSALRAEQAAIRALGVKHGYSDTEINYIVREYHRRRGEALQGFQSRAFSSAKMSNGKTADVYDPGGGAPVARMPLHPSQTVDMLHLPDIQLMDKILARSHVKNSLRAAINTGADISGVIGDTMSGAWKASVLLRLGYPIRVMTDDQFRILAQLGGITYAKMFAEGTASAFRNSFKRNYDKHLGQGMLPKVLEGRVEDALGANDKPNVYFGLSSGDDNWVKDVQVKGRHVAQTLKGSGDWVDIAPGEVQHIGAWYDAITKIQANNPIVQKLLNQWKPDKVEDWILSHDKVARQLRKDVPHFANDPKDWVARIMQDMDNTMPTQEIRDLVRDGQLKKAHLEAIDESLRPMVNGQQIDYNMGGGIVNRTYVNVLKRLYHYLGQLPSDTLSRHPFFAMVYRDRVQQLAKQTLDAFPNAASIPEEHLRRIEKAAREHALKTVKDTLYDISSRSNIAHTVRFISPFFAAWQDVVTTWFNLAKNDPSIFPRSVSIWNAPNQADMYVRDENGNIVTEDGKPDGQPLKRTWFGWSLEVTDEDGNPIKSGHKLWFADPNQQVRLQLPDWLANTIGGAYTVDIGKGSLFSIAQGETPWLPGGGPMVNIAASAILKAKPEYEDALKWALPYGAPPSFWDNVLPATAKNIIRYFTGSSNDPVFAQTQLMIMQTEIIKYQNGDRKTKPTWSEINDRAKNYYLLKSFSSATLPFSPAYKSPYQWFIDQHQKYERTLPATDPTVNPDEMFYRRFGDLYYILTTSLNKNNTGISATKGSLALSRKYADQIAKDPELGRLIIGPVGDADFSTSVYRWQFENEIEPGSGVYYREKITPAEAIKDSKVNLGWMQYRSVINGLRASLEADGYRDFDDPGAENYAAAKTRLTEALATKNPDWRDAYTLHDDDKMVRRIETFQNWVNDPRMNSDPQRQDIQGLAEYLRLRAAFVTELSSRGEIDDLTGLRHKSTLAATSNEDLATAWKAVKAYLISRNTKFSDLYYTYLENDNLQY